MQEPKIILEFSFKKQTQTKIDNIIFFLGRAVYVLA